METNYVIEKRNADGSLDMSKPQPADVFGIGAIQGIDSDKIAKVVYSKMPDAVLDGRELLLWASKIDAKFVTRRKTW